MNAERNLNKVMAECKAELQLCGLLQPELEIVTTRQMTVGRFFVYACVVIIAAVLFALTLFLSPVLPVQSATHSPALFDGEMAVIYRFEQAHTDPYAHARVSDSLYTTRQSQIQWLQLINQLQRHLSKALMIKQLHQVVSLKNNALYKLRYSGVV